MSSTTTRTNSSLPRRLLETLVSPGELFQRFGADAPWTGALVLSTLAGVLLVVAIPEEIWIEQMREGMRQAGASGEAVDPADFVWMARIGSAMGALIVPPVLALTVAGALRLVFSVFLGGEGTFRQYFAVTAHVMVIGVIGGIVTLPMTLASGAPVQLTLSLLAPFLDAESLAFRFLERVEIFAVWSVAVLALGVSVVDRKRSWGGAALVLYGIYLSVSLVLAVAQ